MAEISVREQMIFEIAQLEWQMLQKVYNTGGRAACQDDPDTFFKMRMSQWLVYSDELLESYLEDCKRALNEEGRNLFFEKYVRIMERTFPQEYEGLKQYLPKVPTERMPRIEEIVQVHVKWDAWMMEHYPNIRKNGRTMQTAQDSPLTGPSMETYLRAELTTYSEQTLMLLYKETMAAVERGDNLLKDIIEAETRFYGYKGLDDAEEKQKD